MYFGKAIEFGSNYTGGVHFSVDVVIESFLSSDVSKCLE